MKWVIAILLSAVFAGLPNNIAKINKLKSEAKNYYQTGDYQQAIERYGILIDSFNVTEEEVLMNYANAAFLLTRNTQSAAQGVEGPANAGVNPSNEQQQAYKSLAQNTYTGLAQTATTPLRSQAFNQLGVMSYQNSPNPQPPKDVLVQAQNLFKSALKTDPLNEQARFNYELVTKMIQQQDQQNEDQQDQDQQDQDQQQEQEQEQDQQQDQQDQQQQEKGEDQQQEQSEGEEEQQDQQQEQQEQGEGEEQQQDQQDQQQEQGEGEEQQQDQQQEELNSSPDKMEELKISEEKARMILEAMKNSEVQYIQQNQKKAAKRPQSGKPDW